MGLHIECKFGPKKRGGFRVPVHFLAQANEEELNPRFFMEKEYPLPTDIYGGGKHVETPKISRSYCRIVNYLTVHVNSYGVFEITPVRLLNCGSSAACNTCTIYLPWRPGAHPDYSDFERVFKQIADDIRAMYENVVAEALASSEIQEYQVVLFDSSQETILSQKFQEDTRSRPQRKLKL